MMHDGKAMIINDDRVLTKQRTNTQVKQALRENRDKPRRQRRASSVSSTTSATSGATSNDDGNGLDRDSNEVAPSNQNREGENTLDSALSAESETVAKKSASRSHDMSVISLPFLLSSPSQPSMAMMDSLFSYATDSNSPLQSGLLFGMMSHVAEAADNVSLANGLPPGMMTGSPKRDSSVAFPFEAGSPFTPTIYMDGHFESDAKPPAKDDEDESEAKPPAKDDEDASLEALTAAVLAGRPTLSKEQVEMEQAAMTEEEKLLALSDMFGQYCTIDLQQRKRARRHQENEPIDSKIKEMRKELDDIPVSKKEALVEAQAKCEASEFSNERLEKFLRCVGMNPKVRQGLA